MEGDNITLECQVDTNPSDNVTITWYHDNEVVDTVEDDSDTTLTITNVIRQDAGQYSCSAGNGIDVGYSEQALLEVYCKYQTPVN